MFLIITSTPKQCSHLADFFQRIGDLLEQGQIIFGNIGSIALENLTNLWKYDTWYTLMLVWYKILAHKRLFRALGTIVQRKFGHSPISHKVRGNTTPKYFFLVLVTDN